MSSWQISILGEVADFILGKMLDQAKNKGELRPYLANVNVRWGEFDLDGLREMRFEPREVARYSLRYGDILMCEGGEPGRCAIWKSRESGLMFQKALHRIRPHDCLDSRFLYYSFLNFRRSDGFAGYFTGATIKHLPREQLAKVEIRFPEISTQQKISAILSAYDDLIANNQRRITLLERMAEDIYREWFVRLRFPGHEFAVREKGIPQGWRIRNLGDVMELCYGKALKDEIRVPGIFPVYGSAGVVGTHNAGLVDGPGIVVGRKGNVGSVFWSDHAFFPIDTAYFVRSDTSLHYLFFLLQSMNFINNDSAVPGLNRQQAYSNKLLFPPDELIKQFSVKAKSIFKLKQVLLAEVELLKATRDALLPRLISGKLAVDALDIRFPPGMSPLD